MSGEIMAIVGVGVALAGLMLTSLSRLESRLSGRIGTLESQISELRDELGALRERMAHLEGLLEGLREAIIGRVAS